MIDAVITSFNRPDLLRRTLTSLVKFLDHPIEKMIIIEDSAIEAMEGFIMSLIYQIKSSTDKIKNFQLIFNEKNIGAYESIDKAYSYVGNKYVLHIEDDWEFTDSGFLEKAVRVLESDKMIMQVSLEHNPDMGKYPAIFEYRGVNYQIVSTDKNGWWHGFTCHPSVRTMEGYEKTKPWTQWSSHDEQLSIRELNVGLEYYRLGYKAAILEKSYCNHIGINRCTWHENE